MGGSLLQLVATGTQDQYLTQNPTVTFFKQVYRRHSNFAIEVMELPFENGVGLNRRCTCTISRHGDMLYQLYLKIQLSPLAHFNEQWTRHIGLAIFEEVDVEIGGQVIDRQMSEWMYIWSELTLTESQKQAYTGMINAFNDSTGQSSWNQNTRTAIVPLNFWFCRSPGLALPLVALLYHDVRINVRFRSIEALARVGKTLPAGATLENATILAHYILLENDERRRLAQSSYEVLFDHMQYNGTHATSYPNANESIDLGLKHPVKEIVWVVRPRDATLTGTTLTDGHQNDWFNFNALGSGLPLISQVRLLLNSQDRVGWQDHYYFSVIQPFQHHTGSTMFTNNAYYLNRGIYVYSFALRPEDQQPSGSINFSRMDTSTLLLTMDYTHYANTCDILVFALTNNIFRINGGMGGVAFY